jgi:hypothetical protein
MLEKKSMTLYNCIQFYKENQIVTGCFREKLGIVQYFYCSKTEILGNYNRKIIISKSKSLKLFTRKMIRNFFLNFR